MLEPEGRRDGGRARCGIGPGRLARAPVIMTRRLMVAPNLNLNRDLQDFFPHYQQNVTRAKPAWEDQGRKQVTRQQEVKERREQNRGEMRETVEAGQHQPGGCVYH